MEEKEKNSGVAERTLKTTIGKREIDNEFKTLKRKCYDVIEASLPFNQQKAAKSLIRDAANECWHKMLRYMGIEKEGEYRASRQDDRPV